MACMCVAAVILARGISTLGQENASTSSAGAREFLLTTLDRATASHRKCWQHKDPCYLFLVENKAVQYSGYSTRSKVFNSHHLSAEKYSWNMAYITPSSPVESMQATEDSTLLRHLPVIDFTRAMDWANQKIMGRLATCTPDSGTNMHVGESRVGSAG